MLTIACDTCDITCMACSSCYFKSICCRLLHFLPDGPSNAQADNSALLPTCRMRQALLKVHVLMHRKGTAEEPRHTADEEGRQSKVAHPGSLRGPSQSVSLVRPI